MDLGLSAAAGKHIACEKPLEVSLERVNKMIAACRKHKVMLAGILQRRSNDNKIMQKFSAQQGGPGAGAADPAAIDYVPHQKNFEDMVNDLKNGDKPLVDGAEGRKAIEIILAIYRSALTGGKPVQLPLKRTPTRRAFR